MTDLIGRSLGRYHILEKLGEGGMAVVYKAEDKRLNRIVAVKIIKNDIANGQAKERFLKRFEREAKALAQLSHPNIVKVLDYGEQDNAPYLVMEYIPGGTLKQLISGKTIAWQKAAEQLIPIADALKAAHAAGIIHRDVKPSNILVNANQEPLLTDFGIAKLLHNEETLDLTGTGKGVGTPEYMAPEQGLGKDLDGRADIYSLGVIFFELITGNKPYQDTTPMAVLHRQLTQPLPSIRKLAPKTPKELEWVISKALQKEASDRYSNMDELLKDLNNLARAELSAFRKRRFKQRSNYKNTLVAGVLIITIAGAVFVGIRNRWKIALPTLAPSKPLEMTNPEVAFSDTPNSNDLLTITTMTQSPTAESTPAGISFLENITIDSVDKITLLGNLTYEGEFYNLSSTGRTMLTTSGHIYDIETQKEKCAIQYPQPTKWANAALSDEYIFIPGKNEAKESEIKVWNAETCVLEKSITVPTMSNLGAIALSPDGQNLLFSGYSFNRKNTLLNMDWQSETIEKQKDFGSGISEIMFAGDGGSFVENSGGGFVTIRGYPDFSDGRIFSASSLWGHIRQYAPEVDRLATSDLYYRTDTQIRVWQVSNGKIILQINDAREISDSNVSFSPDMSIFLSSKKNDLFFTNIESNELIYEYNIGKLVIASAFSQNKKVLLVFIDGNRVLILGIPPS